MEDLTDWKAEHRGYEKILRDLVYNKLCLDDNDWEQLKPGFAFKRARASTLLLQNNGYELCARFIVKGIVKITHHTDTPYVFDFREENDYLCDVGSLMNRTRSCFSFETVTSCEWIEADTGSLKDSNNRIMQRFPVLMQEYLNKGYERASFLRIPNAEKRYAEFCRLRPQVVKYAKQGDIASYIHIATQSLSRIRNKMSGVGKDKG